MREKDVTLSKIISKNIRILRKNKFPDHGGQGKCAAAFGADANKWSKWENGYATPTDPEQRKLARFFGVSLAQLRGDDKTPGPAPGVGLEDGERLQRFLDVVVRLTGTAGLFADPAHREWTEAAIVALDAIAEQAEEKRNAADILPDVG